MVEIRTASVHRNIAGLTLERWAEVDTREGCGCNDGDGGWGRRVWPLWGRFERFR